MIKILLIVSLFVSVAVAGSPHVIKLNDSNFERELKKYDLALVKFYAPWCYYSKKLAPDFEKVANFLNRKGSKTVLIEVDCDSNSNTCDSQNVPGYPTLKVFSYGQSVGAYNGKQPSFHMIKHLKEMRLKMFKQN